MDNAFGIEEIGENKVIFTRLPAHPVTREEALNIAVWLIIKSRSPKFLLDLNLRRAKADSRKKRNE